jgi:anti-sigma-K factor RskA
MSAQGTPPTPEDLDHLAAEHVLGLTDPADEARALALMADDPAFRARVDDWRARFAELDATAAAGAPSEALLKRILASVAAAPEPEAAPHATIPAPPARAPTAAPPARPAPGAAPRPTPWFAGFWESLAFWRTAGFAASAAALVLAIGLGIGGLGGAPKPVFVAVLLTPDNQPAAVVNAFGDGTAELIPLRAIEVPQGRALEVWTLQDRGRGPVSIGLLDRARTVRLDLGRLPATGPDQLFEITLEPSAGSPIGRPTGPILMKGTTSAPL